jgi:hypothetical protein
MSVQVGIAAMITSAHQLQMTVALLPALLVLTGTAVKMQVNAGLRDKDVIMSVITEMVNALHNQAAALLMIIVALTGALPALIKTAVKMLENAGSMEKAAMMSVITEMVNALHTQAAALLMIIAALTGALPALIRIAVKMLENAGSIQGAAMMIAA